MPSYKFKYNVNRVIAISLVYILIGALLAVYDNLIMHTSFVLVTGDYSFKRNLLINIGGGFLGGIAGGSVLVFVLKDKLERQPWLVTMATYAITFVAVIIPILSAIYFFIPGPVPGPLDPILLKSWLIWFFLSAATALMLQVNDKYGVSVFIDFITGRYRTPKEEMRIFMFLDLKSSTTVAEKIGHKQYFNLLNDFFMDINDPVIVHKGKIYQYVGDEIVVTWKLKRGISNNNCIRCFYAIKQVIEQNKQTYINKYGWTPGFKAGIHMGTVTTGEVGVMKKEIIFSGDVLNTSSRIQEMCNKYDKELLVSKVLLDHVKSTDFDSEFLGEVDLKGKSERIKLYSLYPSNQFRWQS